MPMASEAVYAHLSQDPWYYLKEKWECREALLDLAGCHTVLEVGSGRGEFIAQMQERGIEATGLELNQSAAREAQDIGRPVYVRRLEECRESYDAVCSFHVFEHLNDPRQFIEHSIAALKPGGLLIIAVPDNDSYIKYERNPLNAPPHHVTRWNAQSLAHLSSSFPLRVERITREPLAAENLELVFDAWCTALPNIPGFIGAIYRLSRLCLPAARYFHFNRWLKGPSIYACYQLIE
jgi:SAM-dependent methyltransferase